MANLPESSTFDAGVYQIELTDPVIGGPSGVSNAPLKNLANRTKYLKDHVDALESSRAPLASPALTGTPTAPTAAANTNTTQIATTAFVNAEIASDAAPIAHVGATGAAHGVATTAVAGFMSAADKAKLDGVSAGATANAGTVTSVTGSAPIVSTGGSTPVISVAAATTSSPGVMSAADKAKLDGIAAGAQVNAVASVDGVTGAITLGALASFAKTFGASGYQKLPSGLIIQWGSYTAGSSGAVYQSFPIAFPNGCFNVSVTGISESVTASDIFGVGGISATNFLVYGSNNADGAAVMRFYWFAIGY